MAVSSAYIGLFIGGKCPGGEMFRSDAGLYALTILIRQLGLF